MPQECVRLPPLRRPASQVTLKEATTKIAEHVKLTHGFDSLRYHGEIKPFAQRKDRLHDRQRDLIVANPANEGLVDLYPVEWKPAQVAHTGVSGAEIIEHDADALLLKAAHGPHHEVRLIQQ